MFAVRQRITIGVWVIGAAVLCAAQSPAPRTAATVRNAATDRADFELVCGACHNSSMVSDVRSQPEWEDTVEHMISIGAKGTPEQIEAVMRVLLRTLTRVNVNTATAAELALPLDIDEATAQALVNYRASHGAFKSLADLRKVPGLDAGKLESRKDRIAF